MSNGEIVQPPEPDEDSTENVLIGGEIDRPREEIDALIQRYIGDIDAYDKEIPFEAMQEIIGFWRSFKIEGSQSAYQQDAQYVYDRLLSDPILVQDYTLYLAHRKRLLNKSYLERPTLSEIKTYAKSTRQPQSIRPEFINTVVPNLVNLGLPRREAYELTVTGRGERKDRVARLSRFIGWLAGEAYMKELPKAVGQAKGNGHMTLKRVATLSVMELLNQIEMHQELKGKAYNMEIPTEAEAYYKIENGLLGSYGLADRLILGEARR